MINIFPGKYPAIVREYDAPTRTCRVEIPGVTDGGDVLLDAEIEYPIGDKAKAGGFSTEIAILPGDTVWIEFIGGDSRYPLITGWRNPRAGNGVDWRRWHHANIELLAAQVMNLIAGDTMTLKAASIVLDGNVRVTGDLVGDKSIVDTTGNTNHHSH